MGNPLLILPPPITANKQNKQNAGVFTFYATLCIACEGVHDSHARTSAVRY